MPLAVPPAHFPLIFDVLRLDFQVNQVNRGKPVVPRKGITENPRTSGFGRGRVNNLSLIDPGNCVPPVLPVRSGLPDGANPSQQLKHLIFDKKFETIGDDGGMLGIDARERQMANLSTNYLIIIFFSSTYLKNLCPLTPKSFVRFTN
ncbi:10775_t:CDS:2 [Acaulospora morrowiae]|uniref:10775_t:CDS:1 n=1 Tax=Acaulospora morrowiae TaxID=94023 RepID=A0A9N8ZB34_9GLOM|nr:10775_t:CDS:2 [Acaulospora morrowiae]